MRENRIHNLHYEKFRDGIVKCIEDEIPFELPVGWEWCRFGSIVTLMSGTTYPAEKELLSGTRLYVKVGDMNLPENEYEISTSSRYLDEYNISHLIPVNSVIFPKRGGAIATNKKKLVLRDEILIDLNTMAFTPISPVNLMYCYYWFLSIDLGKINSGSSVPQINNKDIEPLLFPVPPTFEQERIVQAIVPLLDAEQKISATGVEVAQIISRAKSKILDLAVRGKLVPQDPNDEPASVLLERIRAEKEELIKQGKIKRDKKESFIFRGDDNSYYEKIGDGKEHCIDEELPFELPNGWEWCNLSMIGTTNIGLTYRPTDIIDDGTIVLRSSNIVNDEINLDDLVRVETKIRDNQYVQPNDILICARNGSKSLVGKCALIGNMEEPSSFGAFMAIYRTNYYKYILHYLRSNLFRNVFNDSNSTAINQLTQDMLKRAVIPFPPFEEQLRIVELTDKLLLKTKDIERSLN